MAKQTKQPIATWTQRYISIARDGSQRARCEIVCDLTIVDGWDISHSKIRLVVVSDAYKHQCSARADRFDGSGWQTIATLATGEIATPKGLYDAEPLVDRPFITDLHVLKRRVEAVLS